MGSAEPSVRVLNGKRLTINMPKRNLLIVRGNVKKSLLGTLS